MVAVRRAMGKLSENLEIHHVVRDVGCVQFSEGERIMRTRVLLAVLAALICACPVYAELQQLTINGEIDIRARGWYNTFNTGRAATARYPGAFMRGRAIGAPGLVGIFEAAA